MYATPADLASLPAQLEPLLEGYYVVGTGDSGAAAALLSLAALYSVTMTVGSFGMRVPSPNWQAAMERKLETEAQKSGNGALARKNSMRSPAGYAVTDAAALSTVQFYLIWTVIFGNACGGMALLSSAKTVMGETFGTLLPALVTTSFTTGYVASLSMSNAAGRLGWSFSSDYIGRKNTYAIFALTGVPLVASLPHLGQLAASGGAGGMADAGGLLASLGSPELAALYIFYGGTCLVVSNYGGQFAVLPGYLADLFGERHVGAIHGKVLTAWAGASIVGPSLLSTLRQRSYEASCHDLVGLIDGKNFERVFGAGVSELDQLITQKTVTIPRLLELCPPTTTDPTLFLYDTTFYGISGLLLLAGVSNSLIRKVGQQHFYELERTVGRKEEEVEVEKEDKEAEQGKKRRRDRLV